MNTIAVSGGFDPLNAAHLSLFTNAAKRGALTVILNSDDWLIRKKGHYHMPWAERAALIGALRMVSFVVPVDDRDGTVCAALRTLRPTFFANGSDRGPANVPELDICRELGIRPLFSMTDPEFIDTHSSNIIARGWGDYAVLGQTPTYKVKHLTLLPARATSRQRHKHRDERFIVVSGMGTLVVGDRPHQLSPYTEAPVVSRETWHQILNDGIEPLVLIEVQTGTSFLETDIERMETP